MEDWNLDGTVEDADWPKRTDDSMRSLMGGDAKTTWAGADKEISKERPDSLVNFDPDQPRDERG